MSIDPNPHIFRAYDIRGVADRDLSDALTRALGLAFGAVVRESGGRAVAVGRDCRLSSDRLRDALASGLVDAGVDVLDIGVGPTPLLYFAVHHLEADAGIQITGSHNPPDQNGFKMMLGEAPFFGDAIIDLHERIKRGPEPATRPGKHLHQPVFDAYVERVASDIALARPMKIAVDAGNGAGGPLAMALLERLGVEVVRLYVDMDGTFPNHHADPVVPANLVDLIEAVRREGCDFGVAYDGDADRVGVVDEQGEIIWGDRLTILLARAVLAAEPGAVVVGEVKCSKTLFEDIEAHGGRAVMSAVGHSIIKRRMKAEGAALAGEMSGHIFFAHRWYGFDDGIYTTARLLEIAAAHEGPLSALFADVPKTFVSPEIRLDCPEARKFALVEEAVAYFGADHEVVTIDGARVDFGGGWGLIRASNTQPVIVLRAEAETEAELAEIRRRLETFVSANA